MRRSKLAVIDFHQLGECAWRTPHERRIIMDTNRNTDTNELERSKAHITIEIVEYLENSVVIKTVLKKSTGNVSVMSFDAGEGLTLKTTPFDTFTQVIDGKAEIVIDGKSNFLETGQSIVIPAHTPNFVRPNGRFKLIQTIIKSGYE
jgi:quercetin dioxygenase-like cupin family protein